MIKYQNKTCSHLKQTKILIPKSIKELGEDFCNQLFSKLMTPDQFQALSSIGFMILLDIIYDNNFKKKIVKRLEELHDNKYGDNVIKES